MATNKQIRKDLKQRYLEAFEASYGPRIDGLTGTSRYRGAALRAAIEADWFADTLKVEDVDEMDPDEVRELAAQVDACYAKLMGIDPKS